MINFLTSKLSRIYDDISVKLLRTCPHYIRLPARYLRDQSNLEGTFPKRLRYSKVNNLHADAPQIFYNFCTNCEMKQQIPTLLMC
jgi:hypothetical protein